MKVLQRAESIKFPNFCSKIYSAWVVEPLRSPFSPQHKHGRTAQNTLSNQYPLPSCKRRMGLEIHGLDDTFHITRRNGFFTQSLDSITGVLEIIKLNLRIIIRKTPCNEQARVNTVRERDRPQPRLVWHSVDRTRQHATNIRTRVHLGQHVLHDVGEGHDADDMDIKRHQ